MLGRRKGGVDRARLFVRSALPCNNLQLHDIMHDSHAAQIVLKKKKQTFLNRGLYLRVLRLHVLFHSCTVRAKKKIKPSSSSACLGPYHRGKKKKGPLEKKLTEKTES